MHHPTIAVYEREGRAYATRRGVQHPERAERLRRGLASDERCLDLGCGPGHYLPHLGQPTVALDAARSMVVAVRRDHPRVPAVQGDAADLPFGRACFDAVWASKAHQHLPATELPLALADLHRILARGGRLELTLFAATAGRHTHEEVTTPDSGDDLPGRHFTWWEPDHLASVVRAAGFSIERHDVTDPAGNGLHRRIETTAIAQQALPDHVGAHMGLLCCGLNPSQHAADAGVGYVTGSNRFWRALALAGLSTVDRDPRRLLRQDGIGMTDLVARATPRAADLSPTEYAAGVERLEGLCRWLRPAAVAMVGLAGWRAAVDRRATSGWQPAGLGPTPVYVLPSTSGLNARVSVAELAEHLRAAAHRPR